MSPIFASATLFNLLLLMGVERLSRNMTKVSKIRTVTRLSSPRENGIPFECYATIIYVKVKFW